MTGMKIGVIEDTEEFVLGWGNFEEEEEHIDMKKKNMCVPDG